MLEQAALDGVVECPKCGASLEPDFDKCSCGFSNVLKDLGYI